MSFQHLPGSRLLRTGCKQQGLQQAAQGATWSSEGRKHLGGAEGCGVHHSSPMRSRSMALHCCISLVTPTALATPCAAGFGAPPPGALPK
jgi:hypothetical protein